MTFIASVRAKDGIAVIADSLVTSSSLTLDYNTFLEFLNQKSLNSNKNKASFTEEELSGLFEMRPSHTQNFEQKLFCFDSQTAITTAGNAVINGNRIVQIIEEAKEKLINDQFKNSTLDEKIEKIASFLENEVRLHLDNFPSIGHTTFIISHFNPSNLQSSIFKINITNCSKKDLQREDHKIVTIEPQPSNYPVICDGQNRISERILFGEIYDLGSWTKIIKVFVAKSLDNYGITESDDRESYISDLVTIQNMFGIHHFEDVNIGKLKALSLQQATDLAFLLMRLEIDFQKYTQNIPTVGGVVKLAVIDKNGFRFMLGDKIIPPN